MLQRTRFFVVLGLIACLVLSTAAAADRATRAGLDSRWQDPSTSTCRVVEGPGDPVSLVGLSESVDAVNAPVPRNDSERLLFRQVYETLVRVDCDLSIHAGLASAWLVDATTRAWMLTLRQDARFSDGTPVTAAAVLASWTRGGVGFAPDVLRTVAAATAVDERTLRVVLQEQERSVGPLTGLGKLADPALAIARAVPDSSWPLGTRGLRIEGPATSPSGNRTTLALMPASAGAAASPDRSGASAAAPPEPVMRFLVLPERDGRDLLDRTVDLLVTRDPAALKYAAALAQYDSVPLPWSRSYVFLSRASGPADALPDLLRQKLADDAVPGEARGSSSDWPRVWNSCTSSTSLALAPPRPPQPPATTQSRRIVYDQADPVARALAERIAALASSRTAESNQILGALVPGDRSRKLQAVALPGAVLPAALARGDDAGYLVAIDIFSPCPDLTTLQQQASWLTRDNLVPLVDTRSRALVRKGRAHLALEWDGVLRIAGPSTR